MAPERGVAGRAAGAVTEEGEEADHQLLLPSGISKGMGTPEIADLPVSVLNRLQFLLPTVAARVGARHQQPRHGTTGS